MAAEPAPPADDTSSEAERHQIALWRQMTPAQKLALVSSASRSVQAMAIAGVRLRYPQADEREIFLRLAVLRLGRQLALEVYPEIENLAP